MPRLRSIAAAVDPTMRLQKVMPLDEVRAAHLQANSFWVSLTVAVSSIALLLSLAGIYSVLSFTVSQRTREIGIRVALGADARRVVTAIFRRPLTQVGLGILMGGALTAFLTYGITGPLSPREAALVAAYAVLMMGVCLLGSIVPTRRALRVEPTEALREE